MYVFEYPWSILMIPGTEHVLMSLMEVSMAPMIVYCSLYICCNVFLSCWVNNKSIWRPILMFLVRLQPPVAVLIITAFKEEARQSRRISKKVYLGRWFETDGWVKQTQDFYQKICSLCPVWNQYYKVSYFNPPIKWTAVLCVTQVHLRLQKQPSKNIFVLIFQSKEKPSLSDKFGC